MFFLAVILLTCAVNLGCSVTVELYSGQNYSGLLKKVLVYQSSENNCIQFNQTYEVRSLKTEKCVMVYETEDCKRIDTKLPEGSKLYSLRVEKDTAHFDIDGAYSNRKEERGVKSFQLCGTEPGAGLLNVDIYSGPYYTGDVVASYGGVCECKNIPSYIVLKGKPFSIDNHGKNMYFYDKEDCNGQERLIPAGDNDRSRSVIHLDHRSVVIRSFRLADGLPCPKLDASVYKFTFSGGRKAKTHVEQNTVYITANRQHTSVTEYINVDEWNAAEYTVAKAFTYTSTTRVKAGVLMESRDRITDHLGSTLQSSLEAYYQYPDTSQNTPIIVTKSLGVMPSPYPVDTPPCTTCTVNISITEDQGYHINYTAESIVTGVAGDNKLSAEQVRHFLPPGMEYVKDNDDYSVKVTVEGEMKGSTHGYYPQLSCKPLPDCEPYLRVDL